MAKTTADKLAKSISFEVEATPVEDVIEVRNSENSTPLNVKVKVRKREDGSEVIKRGIITVPRNDQPDTSPERVRLASSDQTIMSFNVFMEADFEKKKENAKTRRSFFGLCLGAQSDDDSQYAPSAAGKRVHSQSDSSMPQNKGVSSKFIDNSQSPKKTEDKFFGKCKPGGCLDPPFGEDNYSYQPKSNKNAPAPNAIHLENLKTENEEDKKMAADIDTKEVLSPSEIKEVPCKEEQKKYPVLSLYQGEPNIKALEGNDSDSIITYPPTLSSSGQNLEEDKKERRRTSNTKQSRNSFNESNGPYYSPPKSTIISSNIPAVTSIPKEADFVNKKCIQRTLENDNITTDEKQNPNIDKLLEKAIATNIMPVPVVSKQVSVDSSESETKSRVKLKLQTNSEEISVKALETSPKNIDKKEYLETLPLPLEKDPNRKERLMTDQEPKIGTIDFKTLVLPKVNDKNNSDEISSKMVNENSIQDIDKTLSLLEKDPSRKGEDNNFQRMRLPTDEEPKIVKDFETTVFPKDNSSKNKSDNISSETVSSLTGEQVNENHIKNGDKVLLPSELRLPIDQEPKIETTDFKTIVLPKEIYKYKKDEISPETVSSFAEKLVDENRIQDGVKLVKSKSKEFMKAEEDKHSYLNFENKNSTIARHEAENLQSLLVDNNLKNKLLAGKQEEPFEPVDNEFEGQDVKKTVSVPQTQTQVIPTKIQAKSTNSKISGERMSIQSNIINSEDIVSRQSRPKSKDSLFARLSRRQSNKSKDELVSLNDQNSIKSRISVAKPILTPIVTKPTEEDLKEQNIAINRLTEEVCNKIDEPLLDENITEQDPISLLFSDTELKRTETLVSEPDTNTELTKENLISISQTYPEENIENVKTQSDTNKTTNYHLKQDKVHDPKLELGKQLEYEISIKSEVLNNGESTQNINFDIKISDISHKSLKLEVTKVTDSSSKYSTESAMKTNIKPSPITETNITPLDKTEYDKVEQKSIEGKSYNIDETKSSKMISQETYDTDFIPIEIEKDEDKKEILNEKEQNRISDILSFEINGLQSNSDIINFSIQYDPNLQKDKIDVVSDVVKPKDDFVTLDRNDSMLLVQNLPIKSFGKLTDTDQVNLKESDYILSKDKIPSVIMNYKTIESSKVILEDRYVTKDSNAIKTESTDSKLTNYTESDDMKTGSPLSKQESVYKESYNSATTTKSVDKTSSEDTKTPRAFDIKSKDVSDVPKSSDTKLKLKDDSEKSNLLDETQLTVLKSNDRIGDIESKEHMMPASIDIKTTETVKVSELSAIKLGDEVTTRESIDTKSSNMIKALRSGGLTSKDTLTPGVIDIISREISEVMKPSVIQSESIDIKTKDVVKATEYPDMNPEDRVSIAGSIIEQDYSLFNTQSVDMKSKVIRDTKTENADIKPGDRGSKAGSMIQHDDSLLKPQIADIKSVNIRDAAKAIEYADIKTADRVSPAGSITQQEDILFKPQSDDIKSDNKQVIIKTTVKTTEYADTKLRDRVSIAGIVQNDDLLLKPPISDTKSGNKHVIINSRPETLNINEIPTQLPVAQLEDKDKEMKDSIYLDLTFQTHLEESQIVIKTLSSGSDNQSDNNVSYIKSVVKLRDKSKQDIGIKVPIGYDHIMNISFKSPIYDSNSRTSKSISKFDSAIGKSSVSGISSIRGFSSNMNTTISSVYNHELVPLQQAIQYLKDDIDDLAKRQVALRDALETKTLKSSRTTHNFSTKGCYCRRN